MPSDDESGDYKVGHGKPPKHSKWPKGTSGNPKGRPPNAPPDAAAVVAILDGPIPVRKGGASTTMHAFEASVRKLVSRAINDGDIRATREFLKLCDRYGVIAPAPEPKTSAVTLIVPKDWEWDDWMAMFRRHGPPPWPGKRSGLPRESSSAN